MVCLGTDEQLMWMKQRIGGGKQINNGEIGFPFSFPGSTWSVEVEKA